MTKKEAKKMEMEKNQPQTEAEKKERYMSLFYDALEENKLLKGGRTHRLSIGGVSLEIVPSAKLSPRQVFNMYVEFLKELKELHGDKHLFAAVPKDGESNPFDGLFG